MVLTCRCSEDIMFYHVISLFNGVKLMLIAVVLQAFCSIAAGFHLLVTNHEKPVNHQSYYDFGGNMNVCGCNFKAISLAILEKYPRTKTHLFGSIYVKVIRGLDVTSSGDQAYTYLCQSAVLDVVCAEVCPH